MCTVTHYSHYLQTHIQSIHKGQRFQCTQCVSKFKYESGLNLHRKSVHEGKMFQCSHCEANFTQKGSLRDHTRSFHNHLQNGTKSTSDCILKQGNDPKDQKKEIDDKKSFRCPACDFAATSLDYLQRHTILNHKGFTLCKL